VTSVPLRPARAGSTASETAFAWSASALAWIALWAAGLPAPHVDDLFFTGTGVALAQGGGLHNPWIEPWLVQHFGSAAFHAQPPLQPQALGLWLRIWGVSTAAILGFQCLAGWLASTAALRLLRRAGCAPAPAIAGWLIVTVFVLARGLRPDAWGAAFALLAGLAWWRDGCGAWLAGGLAAALAVAFHPFAAMAVLPTGGLALFGRLQAKGLRGCVPELALATGTILVVLGLLAALLDFAVADFWRAFHHHAQLRTPAPGTRLAAFWHELTLGREPLLRAPGALALAGALAAAGFAGNRRRAISAAALAAGAAGVGLVLYAGYTPQWLWPLGAGLTLAVWSTVKPFAGRAAVTAVVTFAVCWSSLPWLVGTALARREPAGDYARLRTEYETQPATRLLVDEVAARYVFDFRLPPGSRDWLLARHLDSGLSSLLAAKPPGEIWLVDERKLELYVPDSDVRAGRVRLAGRTFSSWLIHPGRVRLLP
jgi:hypothetical protein